MTDVGEVSDKTQLHSMTSQRADFAGLRVWTSIILSVKGSKKIM